MKRPAFQFYPGDWLNDASLRMVSAGARGLWIDMLCIMHQGSEYGYLKVNGKVILPTNLARMTGTTFKEAEGYLEELEEAGVFSRDEGGCIFSRRMIRDEEIREARAAGGSKGGNPALMGEKKVNLPANLQPTPSSSSSSSSSNTPSRASRFDAQAHLETLGVEPQIASDWLKTRKTKKLAPTLTAFDDFMAEVEKSGLSANAAAKLCCSKGWGGFKASWVDESAGHGSINGNSDNVFA